MAKIQLVGDILIFCMHNTLWRSNFASTAAGEAFEVFANQEEILTLIDCFGFETFTAKFTEVDETLNVSPPKIPNKVLLIPNTLINELTFY